MNLKYMNRIARFRRLAQLDAPGYVLGREIGMMEEAAKTLPEAAETAEILRQFDRPDVLVGLQAFRREANFVQLGLCIADPTNNKLCGRPAEIPSRYCAECNKRHVEEMEAEEAAANTNTTKEST